MKNHGFTLIELLVVVLIIGILSSVALPQYTKAVEKSRAANAYQLIKSINDAQKLANLAQGTSGKVYPFEDLTLTFTDKDGNTATGYSFQGERLSLYFRQSIQYGCRLYRKPCGTCRGVELGWLWRSWRLYFRH